MAAQLAFVLSAGRSGSRAIARLLNQSDSCTSHHEYVRDFTQSAIAEFVMGIRSRESIREVLTQTYTSAAAFSDAAVFVDSNNKLAWIADVLLEDFPDCKVVHLHRDGRKVTSSFYHKLKQAVYPARQTLATNAFLALALFDETLGSHSALMRPPPNEEFWWIQPTDSFEALHSFRSFDRYSQICFHWAGCNSSILAASSNSDRVHRVALESLLDDEHAVASLFSFLEIEYRSEFHRMLDKPDHVYVPLDFQLTESQKETFESMCAGTMEALGYQIDSDEYSVVY